MEASFYETVATVLPVLLLALLFDGNLLQQAQQTEGAARHLARLFIGVPTLATAVGMLTALMAMADGGSDREKTIGLVCVGVALGFLLTEIFYRLFFTRAPAQR